MVPDLPSESRGHTLFLFTVLLWGEWRMLLVTRMSGCQKHVGSQRYDRPGWEAGLASRRQKSKGLFQQDSNLDTRSQGHHLGLTFRKCKENVVSFYDHLHEAPRIALSVSWAWKKFWVLLGTGVTCYSFYVRLFSFLHRTFTSQNTQTQSHNLKCIWKKVLQ